MMKNKLFSADRSNEAAELHFQISCDCYPHLNGEPPKTIAVISSKLPAFWTITSFELLEEDYFTYAAVFIIINQNLWMTQ